MLISAGWASLAALFSFSIAMVVWGRHGDNSIKFLPSFGDLSVPELTLSASQVLSAIAVLLLVFVSGGVIYLSIIEWSDRRRRNALEVKRRK